MVKKIKAFFKKAKLKQEINTELNRIEHKEQTQAENLARQTCEWVELFWNGTKQKFLIHKTDFNGLLTCGRFPNILYKFVDGIADAVGSPELKTDKGDLKKMQEEENEFLIELAERSMVTPTYRECYDAILKVRGITETEIDDVIPKDFLSDLFLFYLKDWEENIKKNLEKFNLNASEESQNTSDVSQAATSKD